MTLKLNGSSSGYTAIDAPAAAGSNTLTLPTSNGSANQYLKNSGTAGTLEFATLSAGTVLKKTYYQIGRSTFTSADFPNDDTIPQIDEGTQVFTQAYTPTNTSGCDIWITSHFHLAETSNVANSIIAALFISDSDDALQVRSNYHDGTDTKHNGDFTIIHKLATWSGAKTFSIRAAGCNSLNYQHYGSQWAEALYGSATCFSPFIIEEVAT